MIYRTLITGASSGIGRDLAMILAKMGHGLVLVARREVELASVAEVCQLQGSPAVATIAGDIRDTDVCIKAVDALQAMERGELVLVNNAGLAEYGDTSEQEFKEIEDTVDVNLLAAMRFSKACLQPMLADGKGTIVNILSIGSRHPFAGAAAYCASKAGLEMFGKCLAAEYRTKGVRVCSILPGATDTPLWESQESHPPLEMMLPSKAVAETIKDVIHAPRDRNIDEVVIMPPHGVL